jgi:hypothetical protein
MGEKYKDRILIDMGEFQSKILEHVCSEEFNKQFDSTQFSTYEDAKGYRQAMMHGMVMASLMAARCVYLCVKEKLEAQNDESEPIENKLADIYGVDTIEFEDPKEFTQHYCHNCGSQRCEGVGTEWFKGCHHKEHLKNYENFYGDE